MQEHIVRDKVESIRKIIIIVIRFEVFTAVTMNNAVFWMLRRVALVRTEVSEESSVSIIRVTRIDSSN
jgi:hypothetical protein